MTDAHQQSPSQADRTPEDPAPATARAALAGRLRAAAVALDIDLNAVPAPVGDDGAQDAARVLDLLAVRVADTLAKDEIWLLLTALSAAYPTLDELTDARRALQLEGVAGIVELLDTSLLRAQQVGEPRSRIRIVTGGVVTDVEHSAKHDLHTGIQRVARSLLPQWRSRPEVVPAVWTDASGALRELRPAERQRALEWGREDAGPVGEDGVDTLLVPWRSVVLLVEVPSSEADPRLAALAAHSGNRLVAIGYDAIPVVSADTVPPADSVKFVNYLSALKYGHAVAAISHAAAAEFSGFVSMLPTQGLTGPTVLPLPLPDLAEPAGAIEQTALADDRAPLVVMIGSFEPRKNHVAVLNAAEQLWREGIDFRIRFIGGSGWGHEFPDAAAELIAAGRPLEILRAVDEAVLTHSYREAAFTVFPSLHEGYGLPVAESLAHGVPVLTSSYGAPSEIAAGGGALTVDPRSDDAIRDGMRTLLTDPAERDRLRAEIRSRPGSDWTRYADALWTVVAEQLALVPAASTGRHTRSATDMADMADVAGAATAAEDVR
ncbi:glycosyltransferase [Nakamurella sp. A5-74]|uniref:Glycosyltransferase n=1 Tax=Nakamurella sp. A5-74 TaxID=3158264 RepID=A0AAU8DKE5_9ACTN